MGGKDSLRIPRCGRCGAEQDPDGLVSVVVVLAQVERPLGELGITHHEAECPGCRARISWHLRTRRILGWRLRSASPCSCVADTGRGLSPLRGSHLLSQG